MLWLHPLLHPQQSIKHATTHCTAIASHSIPQSPYNTLQYNAHSIFSHGICHGGQLAIHSMCTRRVGRNSVRAAVPSKHPVTQRDAAEEDVVNRAERESLSLLEWDKLCRQVCTHTGTHTTAWINAYTTHTHMMHTWFTFCGSTMHVVFGINHAASSHGPSHTHWYMLRVYLIFTCHTHPQPSYARWHVSVPPPWLQTYCWRESCL